ncbi:MAG: DNA replication/repair protein RecF [Candidatus Levybacteria bacterium]|nr:DNA replication/repair protein RecF [Candidatus Levybacteria bacterium]
MLLKHLSLQNFRSYSKSDFNFSEDVNLIVGPNTSGKTNIIEAINLLSTGKSFRTQNDFEMIRFGDQIARVKAKISQEQDELEVLLSLTKKFLVNGVGRRRLDFISNLTTVLFSPADLEIIVDSPSIRRNFLNDVLEQVDREYRVSFLAYTKALRQRNALLEKTREEGVRSEKQFEYWDEILVENGQIITAKREEFIKYVNEAEKDIFDFMIVYDKSIVSKERLLQYKDAEIGAGVTLVGPHRDDFYFEMFNGKQNTTHNVKLFGSRGQQRLAILQLKLTQLLFIKERIGQNPILLLDDIFSELDQGHINLVLEMIKSGQTIITTTHKEFIPKEILKQANMIELGNGKV